MRAKIKAMADFPLHLLCCTTREVVSTAAVGTIIDVVGAARSMRAQCDSCGAAFTELHFAVVGQKYQWIPVSVVDLDEGEV